MPYLLLLVKRMLDYRRELKRLITETASTTRDYTAEKIHFSVYKAVYGLSPGEVMLSVGK